MGRVLLVGSPSSRGESLLLLRSLGYVCDEADDPYSAMSEICRRATAFGGVILCLASMYKEELQVVSAIKRRSPKVDVWLAQSDGRQSAMIEAISLGADGLLSADGLHRVGLHDVMSQESHAESLAQELEFEEEPASVASARPSSLILGEHESEMSAQEPVLSADELRALLQEPPLLPPRGDEM